MTRVTPGFITKLEPDQVFVFGSNTSGRHGKGAAAMARKFGARNGVGAGIAGQTYGIPTKDDRLKTLSLGKIRGYVDLFVDYAHYTTYKKFLVTPIGCGLAGLTPEQIAPMFKECLTLENVWLPKSFLEVLQ